MAEALLVARVLAFFSGAIFIPLGIAFGVTTLILRRLRLRVNPLVPKAVGLFMMTVLGPLGALLMAILPAVYSFGLFGLSEMQLYLILVGSWALIGTVGGVGFACRRRLES